MDNQELYGKLTSLKGKHEFFKAQKADNEEKKRVLLEELKGLGFSSVDELRAAIKDTTAEIEGLEAALAKSITAVEAAAQDLDAKIKGQYTPPPSAVEETL